MVSTFSRGVYLVFVATRSGLTRYADLNLEDVLLYDIPTTTTTTTTTTTHAVDHNSTLEPKLTTPLPPMKEEKTEPYVQF